MSIFTKYNSNTKIMNKKQKKHVENKPVFKASKALSSRNNTNVSDSNKKPKNKLKRGLKGIDTVSKPISFDSLIRCSSIVLSLMLHYRLNNRVDVYVFLVLLSSPVPLSLSALTRLAGVSNASYVAESLRRLIDLDVVHKSVCSSPFYCLSVSCKEEIMSYM